MERKILIVGRHPQIMETVLRLIHTQTAWKAIGAMTDEEAIQHIKNDSFQLVLIGGGVETNSEDRIRETVRATNPNVPVIRHYGGGSGLLFNEIEAAWSGRD